MSNEKQLGLAFVMYSQDYDDHMVPAYWGVYTWPALIKTYVKNTQVFNCPSDTVASDYYDGSHTFANCSYGYNQLIRGGLPSGVQAPALADIEQPTATVIFTDDNGWQVQPSGVQFRHLDTAVVAFCDGHVKVMKPAALNAVVPSGGSESGVPQSSLWQYGGSYTLWNRK
jgi:prepilin-type processing-associated H-X9-DG protein